MACLCCAGYLLTGRMLEQTFDTLSFYFILFFQRQQYHQPVHDTTPKKTRNAKLLYKSSGPWLHDKKPKWKTPDLGRLLG